MTVALTAFVVAAEYTAGQSSPTIASSDDAVGDAGEGERRVAAPRPNITVIATDSNSWLGRERDGPRARADLLAFAPNDPVPHYDDTNTRYWDVDPVPGRRATVEYGYADHLNRSDCPTDWDRSRRSVDRETWDRHLRAWSSVDACTRNGVEGVNLTTGEVTPVWSRITPGKPGTCYHDVDRLNRTHLVVADISLDRVYVVNAGTDRTE